MRILQVIQRYYPFQGGSERYFFALARQAVAAGNQVHVVTTNAWDLEGFWDPRARHVSLEPMTQDGIVIRRVPVRYLPAPRLSHRAIRRLMAESGRVPFPGRRALLGGLGRFGPWLPGIDATLAGERPDVVHSANIAFESMVAASARFARQRGVPHVVTPFVHLGEGPRSKVRRYYTMPHQLALLRRADAVLALTPMEADYLMAGGVPRERLRVVGAGIDVASVTGGDGARARERFGLRGPVVLSLGAAAYDKGTVHLVDAVCRLHQRGENVDLVVAGPALTAFTRYVDALPAAERRPIHVLGFVSEEDKRDLLAAADVVVLASRTESFGLVFLEAWANGKPVIGARAGAIPAVVEDGRDGLLVAFGDVDGLAEAVSRLIADRALATTLAERGRRKVVDERVWFDRVLAVYEELTGRPARDTHAW